MKGFIEVHCDSVPIGVMVECIVMFGSRSGGGGWITTLDQMSDLNVDENYEEICKKIALAPFA